MFNSNPWRFSGQSPLFFFVGLDHVIALMSLLFINSFKAFMLIILWIAMVHIFRARKTTLRFVMRRGLFLFFQKFLGHKRYQ